MQLARFDSVRKFAKDLKALKSGKPLDSLVCNAAVYLPARDYPTFTPDGIEESLQINHLSHFLLISLLIDDLRKAKDPRCVIVGSITGNTNTIGGAFVFPRANLGDLRVGCFLQHARFQHTRVQHAGPERLGETGRSGISKHACAGY